MDITDFNQTDLSYFQRKCVHELFAEQMLRQLDEMANSVFYQTLLTLPQRHRL